MGHGSAAFPCAPAGAAHAGRACPGQVRFRNCPHLPALVPCYGATTTVHCRCTFALLLASRPRVGHISTAGYLSPSTGSPHLWSGSGTGGVRPTRRSDVEQVRLHPGARIPAPRRRRLPRVWSAAAGEEGRRRQQRWRQPEALGVLAQVRVAVLADAVQQGLPHLLQQVLRQVPLRAAGLLRQQGRLPLLQQLEDQGRRAQVPLDVDPHQSRPPLFPCSESGMHTPH